MFAIILSLFAVVYDKIMNSVVTDLSLLKKRIEKLQNLIHSNSSFP